MRSLSTAAVALFLSACAGTTIQTMSLPQKALEPTPDPVLEGESNRAGGILAVELKAALGECNKDKAAIRKAVTP